MPERFRITRFGAILALLLSASDAARADGEIGIFLIGAAALPAHALIFAPLIFLSNMEGRRLQAAGWYAGLVFILYWMQVSNWYVPIRDAFYHALPVPFLDLALLSVLGVIALYFWQRDRDKPVIFRAPVPMGNIWRGLLFSVIAIIFWWGPWLPVAREFVPNGSKGAAATFFLCWTLLLPFFLIWCAYRIFRYGHLLGVRRTEKSL